MLGHRAPWKLLQNKTAENILVPGTLNYYPTRQGKDKQQNPRYCSLYATAATQTLNPRQGFLQFPNRNVSIACSNSISTYDHNVRMGELGRRGNVRAAREVFDEMPRRDPVSYASMISIYLKHNELLNAESLFVGIPEDMRSVVADSAMVHAYAKAGRLDRAKEVFDGMPRRNAFAWTSLISGYFKMGRVGDAVELFEEMPEVEKNEVTWTNVIVGFSRNGLIDEARRVFNRMPVKNVVSWTSMVKAYVENDRVDEGIRLFRAMPQRNLYSWNIVISALLDEGRVDEVREMFDSMPWRNVVSWTTMVTGFARNGMTGLARKYFDRMPYKDVSAWNAMITAYVDEGCMAEAGVLFKLMPSRNIVTWNAMIDGYGKDQNKHEAFKHFILMLQNGIRPNEMTLTSLLTSCSGILGVLQVHGFIVHLGFDIETSLVNTLITMYYRSGDLASARIAFESHEVKDVVTWTAMILAYSNHGFGIHALQVFAQMLRSGHIPDEITYTGVLSACSHAGLVKKGQMLFDSISTSYGLEPTPEHYACLVDILGRAGLVNEAMKVVHEMPRDKCDSIVRGALLGACKLHGDGKLADYIGNELIELDPASSGRYVLLANVYAACKKWDKFSLIRKTMKEREVKKVPGFSQIDVNGKSHVFLVGDRSHPEMKEIYMLLHEKLLPLMEDTGYNIANLPEVF